MANAQQILSVDELASLAGMSSNMVNFYVRSHLLSPPMETAKGSFFTAEHVQRLNDIQAWKADGLSNESIFQRVKGFRNPWFTQGENPLEEVNI